MLFYIAEALKPHIKGSVLDRLKYTTIILVHASLLLMTISELLKHLNQLWSRQERDGNLKQVRRETLMEGLFIKVWEGLKKTNKGQCRTLRLATGRTMATPWSERTSVGNG